MPLSGLSIVIPAYNEADRIAPTLRRILEWTAEHAPDPEIIVVDDGSTDDTIAVAGAVDPGIIVLSNGRNRGKGYSVAHGVRETSGDLVLFTDADLSTPIEDVLKLHRALASAPIAIGSRAVADSDVSRRQPVYRESMGRIFNQLVQLIVMRGIRDSQCGFKLFEGDVARELFAEVETEGFAFDVEVLLLARKKGYAVAEVGVKWVNDERTTVHAVYDSLRMLRDVVRLRLRHRSDR